MKYLFGERITANILVRNPLIFTALQAFNCTLLRGVGMKPTRLQLFSVERECAQLTYLMRVDPLLMPLHALPPTDWGVDGKCVQCPLQQP